MNKESQAKMDKYEKAYEDCKVILGSQKHYLDSLFLIPSKYPSDENLKNFNEYLKGFLEEEDRGMLRTLLIIGKPFKNNEIVKDTLSVLADKLRAGSKSGMI